ncbi:interferon alpha/beta receptor 2 isoform X2 [Sceloporus undulatus]|uniref:interferon alpha/beta receptor 2 isoform X2 n=1 Tax=Sceloporus undulatus TaxID=8520 RepID=UPI001C4BF6B7|nr:interferon alpha/beta receptor 2 isoform X2 [Sceloporus undulatus]
MRMTRIVDHYIWQILDLRKLIQSSRADATVYISVITSVSCSLLDKPTLKMNPRDFEYILTWETGNNTRMPACFSVMYYERTSTLNCPIETGSDLSKKGKGQDPSSSKSGSQQSEDSDHQVLQPGEPPVCPSLPEGSVQLQNNKYRTVMECSNITRSFCNLTKEFSDPCKTYIILVEQVTENGVRSSTSRFNPYLDTCLSEPEFNISACPNCVNVTVKLSSSSLLNVYKDIKYTVTASTAGLPDKQDNNTTKQQSFYAVMGNLLPNRNYCLTVDVCTTVATKQCTPSSPKCIITSSKNKSDHITTAALTGVFMPLLVVLILFVLYEVGLICLKTDWPNVLEIIPKLAYSVFDSVPEELHTVKVTEKSKKKVWHYDDDDYVDDDNDSGSDVENNGFYTVRKIFKNSSTVDTMEDLSIDRSSSANETVEPGTPEAESFQNEINEGESGTTNQFFNHSSEVNSTNEPELKPSSCLNVNLNTVKLGTSVDTLDVPATLDPDQEDSANLKESCINDDSESIHFTDIPNVQSVHSLLCAWQNSSESSEESESSDSETVNVGYMGR